MSMRRVVAGLLTAALVASSLTAHAEESAAPSSDQSDANRVKRLFIYSAYGVGALGLIGAIVSSAQATSAFTDIETIAKQNGTAGSSHWGCTTPEECARLRSLREDQDAAKDRWAWGTGLAIAGLVSGTVFLLLYLHDQPSKSASTGPRLAPSVGPRDAGVHLVGRF